MQEISLKKTDCNRHHLYRIILFNPKRCKKKATRIKLCLKQIASVIENITQVHLLNIVKEGKKVILIPYILNFFLCLINPLNLSNRFWLKVSYFHLKS